MRGLLVQLPYYFESSGMDRDKYLKQFIDGFYRAESFVMLEMLFKYVCDETQRTEIKDKIISIWSRDMDTLLENDLKSAEMISIDKDSSLVQSIKSTIIKNHECNKENVYNQILKRFESLDT